MFIYCIEDCCVSSTYGGKENYGVGDKIEVNEFQVNPFNWVKGWFGPTQWWFPKDKFLTIEEWRNIQLESIL